MVVREAEISLLACQLLLGQGALALKVGGKRAGRDELKCSAAEVLRRSAASSTRLASRCRGAVLPSGCNRPDEIDGSEPVPRRRHNHRGGKSPWLPGRRRRTF